MTYADVITRMQAIQTQLVQLGMVRSSAPGTSDSAASFASALDGASVAPAPTSSTASTAGALVSPNGATGDDVVKAALAYRGVPYVLGGESKSGIDCSGLVQAALGSVGVAAPRTVHEQKLLGERVDSLKDARPGDLIVLNGGDHIAVYLGNDTVIHAPYPGRTVSVQKAWFDDKDITTIRRVVPAGGDATDAAVTTATGTTAPPPAQGVATAAGPSSAADLASAAGLSPATVARATAMLGTVGTDVGLGGSGSDGGGDPSLSSMLASFGLGGAPTGTGASSQLIAARTALLGAGT